MTQQELRYVITYSMPHEGPHAFAILCLACAKSHRTIGPEQRGVRMGYCDICDGDPDDKDGPPAHGWLSCGQDW